MIEFDTHPDAQRLAAYIDGMLLPAEREAIDEHLVTCGECRATLVDAAVTSGATSGGGVGLTAAEVRPFRHRSRVTIVAALAALAAAILVAVAVWRFGTGPGLGRDGVSRELVQALALLPTRPAEGRLAGPFVYKPAPPIRRGGHDADLPPELRIAAANADKALRQSASADTRRQAGIAALAIGDLDRAVDQLEQAGVEAPTRGEIQSDLAVTYLERSRLQGRPDDLAKALSAAERGAQGTAAPAAVFNRALVLERLHLTDAARAEWQRFLSIEPSGDWSREAQAHLRQLDSKTGTARANQTRRREAIESCLGAWADARLAHRDDTVAVAAGCVAESAAFRAAGGDRLTADAADFVERSEHGPGGASPALVGGHHAYIAAIQLYDDDRYGEAGAQFARAEHDLSAAGSPLALMASYYVALVRANAGDVRGADEAYARLRAAGERIGSPLLVALTSWHLGVEAIGHGDFDSALGSYRTALSAFERVGEREHAANMHSLLAEAYRTVGDLRQAWAEHDDALRLSADNASHRIRHQVLVQCSLTSLRALLPEAALAFHSAAIENARQWNRAGALTSVYLQRARALQNIGRLDAAMSDLSSAKRWRQRIPDPAFGRRFDTELLLAEGEVLRRTDARRAVDLLGAAELALKSRGMLSRVPELLLIRSRAESALGDVRDARHDLDAGVDLLEQQRRTVGDDALRLSYANATWDLYEDLVTLRVASHEMVDVLGTVEQSRSRALLARLPPEERDRPLDVNAFRAGLANDVAVLYFAVLPEKTLVWTITRERIVPHQLSIGDPDLARRITAWRLSLHEQSDQSARFARELHEMLIAPMGDELAGKRRLVIVPDGPLYELPFAALVDARTGTYLIDRFTLITAPSAALLQYASARLRAARVEPTRVIVVANPDADNGTPLPGAEHEAATIARYFPEAVVLNGKAATVTRVSAALETATLAHFATHAIANPEMAATSRLVLASEPNGRGGSWFASGIAATPVPKLRMVVLAACNTAEGPRVRGEGVVSLARPFLAAGVPLVIAALWDIDDAATQRLFESFYRSLHDGTSPADALRVAQTAAIHSGDAALANPLAWAGLEIIGGLERQ